MSAAVLDTPRLRLRPLTDADLDALTAIWTDPDVSRLLITQPRSRAEVAEKLVELKALAHGFGMWGVELRASGELVGRCGFYRWTGTGGSIEPELAFLFARQYWGAGVASEAGRAALDALFRCHAPARAVAVVRPEHAASRRVLGKLGMREMERVVVKGVAALLYATPSR
jgi:RimJ/RimL family protein N-acetyltransferase